MPPKFEDWQVALTAIVLAAVFIYSWQKSKRIDVVSKGGKNPESSVAIDCLVELGWDRDTAERKVGVAIERKPSGDAEELVNIAIRVEG